MSQRFFTHLSKKEVIIKYDPSKAAKPWLGKILKNQLLDYLRDHKRHECMTFTDFGSDQGPVELVDKQVSPPGLQLEAKEVRERMYKVLRGLSVAHLELCCLKCEGLTDENIARRLKIPAGTVKSSLYSVRKQFASLGDPHHDVRIIGRDGVNPIIEFLNQEIKRRGDTSWGLSEAAVA